METDDRLTYLQAMAYHEAGHAVVAYAHNLRVSNTWLTRRTGVTEVEDYEDRRDPGSEEWRRGAEHAIMSRQAGQTVWEIMGLSTDGHLEVFGLGSSDDQARAKRLALLLAEGHGEEASRTLDFLSVCTWALLTTPARWAAVEALAKRLLELGLVEAGYARAVVMQAINSPTQGRPEPRIADINYSSVIQRDVICEQASRRTDEEALTGIPMSERAKVARCLRGKAAGLWCLVASARENNDLAEYTYWLGQYDAHDRAIDALLVHDRLEDLHAHLTRLAELGEEAAWYAKSGAEELAVSAEQLPFDITRWQTFASCCKDLRGIIEEEFTEGRRRVVGPRPEQKSPYRHPAARLRELPGRTEGTGMSPNVPAGCGRSMGRNSASKRGLRGAHQGKGRAGDLDTDLHHPAHEIPSGWGA